MKATLGDLERLLDAAAEGLERVAPRTMFGCHALFADGKIFALIWKAGRVGVKLTDERDHAALLGMAGASPWKVGAKTATMSKWVLVPPAFHDEAALAPWVEKAHAQALAAPPKPKPKPKAKSKSPPITKSPPKKSPLR